MAACGMRVAPQYNEDGVGYQLLMARTPLCRDLGIDLTVTTFSNSVDQYMASQELLRSSNNDTRIDTLASYTYRHAIYVHDVITTLLRVKNCSPNRWKTG
ncbi:hypothetical protein LSTR_LSTR002834 [Laodelphax striatellus]|uniref:Uncharacterized protein n=1 Tax=Laodelphax striatellus TaxID=195883 RepID=A0A482XJD7_LAOST|nr:hypothetical protein LSTR_LSTR002834 [Laodelphax striatellus]